MSYLLTNGIITDKIEVYIKDMIQMNFKLYPTDLPYNKQLGIERRLHEIALSEFQDAVRTSVNDFIVRLNRRHGLSLSISQLEVTTTKVEVNINMGDDEVIAYEMPLNK